MSAIQRDVLPYNSWSVTMDTAYKLSSITCAVTKPITERSF